MKLTDAVVNSYKYEVYLDTYNACFLPDFGCDEYVYNENGSICEEGALEFLRDLIFTENDFAQSVCNTLAGIYEDFHEWSIPILNSFRDVQNEAIEIFVYRAIQKHGSCLEAGRLNRITKEKS